MEENNKTSIDTSPSTDTTSTAPTTEQTEPTTTETSPTTPQGSEEKKKSPMPIVIGILLAALVAGAAYIFFGNNIPSAGPSAAGVSVIDSIEPDALVARVNGVELLGEDLVYQMTQVAQLAGASLEEIDHESQELIKQQSINAIINTEVLVQTAEAAGIAITEDEVEREYETIVESIGGQEVADERLAILGVTEEKFKENLVSDLAIQKYVTDTADADVLAVSDEEIEAFYAEVSSTATGEVPPLEDVRFQIAEQLKFKKEQDAVLLLIEELRQSSDIEILID